ncbi:dephospho-CoA kinase [Paraliobacillus sediminis]|uniref:dephospho-CoA kinase n=1 Tax=Paraliobacillus sediminis TaxID=1885916 RepID=UPI000E3DE93F|nr:dephospho-CoA kinase [Paraliobacillus sediminis]
MTKIIGLTGGIASGKSTVANFFREKQIPIIDADVIAKEVVEPDKEAYFKIVEAFGEGILQSNRMIDRKKLGHIVFQDKVAIKKLNEIVHPFVKREMSKQKNTYVNAQEKIIVLDIPLLFESKLTSLVDQVWVVFVKESTQLTRLMKRNDLSEYDAISRIRAQIPLDQKAENADVIINNNGSVEDTKRQFEKYINQI